jgi:hypothetical protein
MAWLPPVLLCCGVSLAHAEEAQVRLKPVALVHDRIVVLGEVADISAADASTVRALSEVRLGKAPRIGYAEHLTLAEVRRLARTQLGEGGERVAWDGARAVRLETAARSYDGTPLVEAAVAHVARSLAGRYERVDVRPAEAAPTLLLPAGSVAVRVRDGAFSERPGGRVAVWVDVLVDGEFYRAVVVPLQLELHGALRGQLAVNRGDTVTLRLRRGAIAIESTALALSSGSVGQTVKVRPGASDTALMAEVLSDRVVQLKR